MAVFRKFFCVFGLQYLRMKSLLLCLLLMPMLCAGIALWHQDRVAPTTMTAGVMMQSEGIHTQSVLDALLGQKQVTFVCYTQQDAMIEDVKSGKITVGYLFSADFEQAVADLDTKKVVSVVKLENDMYHRYLNEIVYTAVYGQMVPYMTQNFLQKRDVAVSVEEIKPTIDAYLQSGTLFTIDVVSLQQVLAPTAAPQDMRVGLVRGVLCMGLLLFTLLCAIAYAGNQGGQALFVPYLGKVRGAIYALVPACALGLCAAFAALGVVEYLAPGLLQLCPELVRLLLYQVVLLGVAFCLPRILSKDTILLFIPFLMLFVLVTHPILFDAVSLVPQLKPVLQCLPSYWYLTAFL